MVAASTSQLEEERNAALTQHKAVHVQVEGREVTNIHCRGVGLQSNPTFKGPFQPNQFYHSMKSSHTCAPFPTTPAPAHTIQNRTRPLLNKSCPHYSIEAGYNY